MNALCGWLQIQAGQKSSLSNSLFWRTSPTATIAYYIAPINTVFYPQSWPQCHLWIWHYGGHIATELPPKFPRAKAGRRETCRENMQYIKTADLWWSKAFTHLIKVSDDLIEQPETLDAHVVPVQLNVEVVEVGDGGEQHSNLSVGLVVQVLKGWRGGGS